MCATSHSLSSSIENGHQKYCDLTPMKHCLSILTFQNHCNKVGSIRKAIFASQELASLGL